MLNKRNRWLINIIMAIAVISFTGIAVIAPFTQAFRDNPQADSAPAPRSSPASRLAELQEQAKGYELVLQREPANQTALKGLVDTRIQIASASGKPDDLKGIIAPLEKLAQLNPDQTDFTVLLAQAKLETGDREGAAQAYRSILSKHPGDLNALQGIVKLQIDQQRPEAAIGLLQDTLQGADAANKVQPGSVDVASVRLLLAQVYAREKRDAEAIAIYDEIIKTDAQDFRPVLGKAIVLQAQGKKDEAQPLFTSAAALAPAQYKDQIQQIAQGIPPTAPAPGTAPNAAPAAPAGVTAPAAPAPSPAASPQ